jgi:uncharacterized protein YegJ (DUF2314 family)
MTIKRASDSMIAFFFGLLLAFLSSCSDGNNKDKVINVAEDDPDMSVAITKARSLLPQFWQVFGHHEHGETDFCLKFKITDNGQTEHFWAVNVERKDTKIFGTINNDPEIIRNVKIGDRIPIPEDDISDWLYMQNGKMVGNYTLRVLFKQMSASEVEKYKAMLADP